jgi:predicted nucleic-acid-binding protein
MRSLDTNVLVRYLAADDPKQLAAAEKLIEGSGAEREPLFLTVLVLCELVWVLSRSYGYPKDEIVNVLERVLSTDQFKVEREEIARRSLDLFRKGKGSFSDYVIGEISMQAGCRDVVTFDKDLRGARGFTLLA